MMGRNKLQAALPEELKDASGDIEAGEPSRGGVQYSAETITVEGRLGGKVTRNNFPQETPHKRMGYLPVQMSTIPEDSTSSTRMGHFPVDRTRPSIPEIAVVEQGHRGTEISSDQLIVPYMAYLPVGRPGISEGASRNRGYESKGDSELGATDPPRKVSIFSKYLQNQLQSLEGTMVETVKGSKSKIQKVHPRLRKKQDFEKHYNPEVLALGPIHHRDNELKEAERLKLNLAGHFIRENDVIKEDLCSKILMKIEDLKGCYAADVLSDYDDDELTWIFLVDGCAVLCFIQCLVVGGDGKNIFFRYDELESLNIKIDRIPFILRDLFLLENQLPYHLLLLISSAISHREKELIYSIKLLVAERAGADSPPSQEHVKEEPNHLLDLLRDFLIVEPEKMLEKSTLYGLWKPKMTRALPDFTSHHHRSWKESDAHMAALLYAGDNSSLRNFGETSSDKEKPQKRPWLNKKQARYSNQHTFRNVTELKASGVGFKRSETNSLKAIAFHPGWFLGDVKLPLLRISDDSAPIFLNLVAYEMCPDFKNEYEVTSYICFLDSLIDRPEDVAELRKANILHNLFGSDEEVAKLFNEIGTDLVPNPRTYLDVKEQIYGVYQNKWKVWLAQFLNDHFSSPWSVLAFVGAIFALALTLVQTWYTINPK